MTPASRLLLDTHIFLWWRAAPSRLVPKVQNSIATADVVFISAATAWEAGIKASLGRLELPDTIEAGVLASGFEKLLITFSHAERAAGLPPHHRDPFDRMLVAQALLEGMTLVSNEKALDPLGATRLW